MASYYSLEISIVFLCQQRKRPLSCGFMHPSVIHNHNQLKIILTIGEVKVCWITIVSNEKQYIDKLMQERRNSIAYALELRLSCTNLSIFFLLILT